MRTTVLVVDDDADVREYTKNVLEDAGYHVIEASNAGEAMAVSSKYGDHIQLLLTDVIMPERNGPQLAEAFLRRHENSGVLFTSGYTAEAMAHQGVHLMGHAFLAKPFDPDDLLERVSEVIDGRYRRAS
jgi:two-component system, cell cycle sensor histidine kinase and response regulator CckA